MTDFTLSYEVDGHHYGLGACTTKPPDRFIVREWQKGASYTETAYMPERTCHLEQIPYSPSEYEGIRCSICKTPDPDMGYGPYCAGCGARVVDG